MREPPSRVGDLGHGADLAPLLVGPVGHVDDRESRPLGEEVDGGVGLDDLQVVAEERLEQLAEEQVGHRVSPLPSRPFALEETENGTGNVIAKRRKDLRTPVPLVRVSCYVETAPPVGGEGCEVRR